MEFFFDDHPILARLLVSFVILIIIIGLAIGFTALRNRAFNGNQQVIDTTYGFHWAIIDLGNDEVTEGAVKTWRDYQQSDMIQVTMEDGTTYLTHSSRILLSTRRPD